MAKRYGYEGEPRRQGQRSESGGRRGGGYGMGGAERGYNQGGYGGVESHEEGYTRGSYDRLLGVTERYHGYGDEDYGRAREDDERYWYERDRDRRSAETYGGRHPDELYRPTPVGLGRESFGDEWMSFERSRDFERSRSEELQREPRGAMEWTARARGPGKAPRGYTRSDERIREDICERLMGSPYDASDVEVLVNKGEVTLTGTVRSRADKWGIEDVAEAILGVQDVHNQIRINRDEAQRPGSTTLAGDTGHLHS